MQGCQSSPKGDCREGEVASPSRTARGGLPHAAEAGEKGGHLNPHQRTRNLGHTGCSLALEQLAALCLPPPPPALTSGQGGRRGSGQHGRTSVPQAG